MANTLSITNFDAFMKGLDKLQGIPEKIIRKKMMVVLKLAHQKITARTPVHTGKALRNWVWSMDTPYTGQELPAIGSGPTGQTSKMSMGSEPRRSANQSAADKSFAALDLSKPMRSYWLSNNADDILDLEYGKLPTSASSRNPAGMVRITVEEILQALRTGA